MREPVKYRWVSSDTHTHTHTHTLTHSCSSSMARFPTALASSLTETGAETQHTHVQGTQIDPCPHCLWSWPGPNTHQGHRMNDQIVSSTALILHSESYNSDTTEFAWKEPPFLVMFLIGVLFLSYENYVGNLNMLLFPAKKGICTHY